MLHSSSRQPSDPATDVYNALVDLVEEKKLRPGEVLNYAHFHWCLDTPEAIVAWQTGRDKWTVNNCSNFCSKFIPVVQRPSAQILDVTLIVENCGFDVSCSSMAPTSTTCTDGSLRLTSLAMSLTSASMSGTTVAIRRPGPSLF